MFFGFVVRIRVGMTQFCKQRSFQRFHFFGFVVIYMVVTQ